MSVELSSCRAVELDTLIGLMPRHMESGGFLSSSCRGLSSSCQALSSNRELSITLS